MSSKQLLKYVEALIHLAHSCRPRRPPNRELIIVAVRDETMKRREPAMDLPGTYSLDISYFFFSMQETSNQNASFSLLKGDALTDTACRERSDVKHLPLLA